VRICRTQTAMTEVEGQVHNQHNDRVYTFANGT